MVAARKHLKEFEAEIAAIKHLTEQLNVLDYTARKAMLHSLLGTSTIGLKVGYIKDITLERVAAFEENNGLEGRVFWLFALRGKSSDLGVFIKHALIPCHPQKILDALRTAGIYPKLLSKESSFGRAVG
jgi:hypothetical protein